LLQRTNGGGQGIQYHYDQYNQVKGYSWNYITVYIANRGNKHRNTLRDCLKDFISGVMFYSKYFSNYKNSLRNSTSQQIHKCKWPHFTLSRSVIFWYTGLLQKKNRHFLYFIEAEILLIQPKYLNVFSVCLQVLHLQNIHGSHSTFCRKMCSSAGSVPLSSHLTTCTPTKSTLYLDCYFKTVITEHALYKLLTFRVPNVMFIFCHLNFLSKGSVQVRGSVNCFITRLFFKVMGCQPHA
jgi:hypothetical protein